jgi:hypothetical protein
MDCVLVLRGERLAVVEPRRLRAGEAVVVGRTENGEEGIFIHQDFLVNLWRSLAPR